MSSYTEELLLELQKIESDRIKKEEKEKQIQNRIKLEQEKENLEKILEEKNNERKLLEEEELIKKQNQHIKDKIEKLKNQKLNVFIDNEECFDKKIDLNNYKDKEIINIELKCNKQEKEAIKNNNYFNLFLSLLIGVLLSYFYFSYYYKDDGIYLSIDRPRIIYLTEIIEKEVIVEKEVKQNNNLKPQNTKQVTNVKQQQNTPTVTKPKSKCPVSDPLCGIF